MSITITNSVNATLMVVSYSLHKKHHRFFKKLEAEAKKEFLQCYKDNKWPAPKKLEFSVKPAVALQFGKELTK